MRFLRSSQQHNFYPRPPRGGRQKAWYIPRAPTLFLSTPSARRATVLIFDVAQRLTISIHALREEGDTGRTVKRPDPSHFYPRPPRGGRRGSCRDFSHWEEISIHALREEGDLKRELTRLTKMINFYPRPPRGGRQQKQRENTLLLSHYTPLCTNCKEMSVNQTAKSHRYLRKRLVFRCEASRKTMCAADSHWPDIKRSARCLGQILGAVQRARPWSGSCCPAGRTADCPRQGRSGRSALL